MEERIGSGNRAFVVIDRRGEAKPEREVEVKQESEIEAKKDKSGWKDVSYMMVQAQMQLHPQQNPVVINLVRAVGRRTDDRPFIADYALPPFWTEKQDMDDWQAEARHRLNTFLNCGCLEGGKRCGKHEHMIPSWEAKDTERIEKIARKSMPESLEWYIRAEQSRQQGRIVAPGR